MPTSIQSKLPVLLAEDNPDDVMLVQRLFRRLGISELLRTAPDGAAALSMIQEMWKGPIGLIILDIKMPVYTGLNVLDQLPRDGGVCPPVVMFTSSDDDGDVDAAYRKGANAYVCKPVDFEEYMETLERLIRFWLTDNRICGVAEPSLS